MDMNRENTDKIGGPGAGVSASLLASLSFSLVPAFARSLIRPFALS
jgi:hypothetical protein